ncbi:uncharacterized protein LOC115443772 [Manduca sexta]|uniref:BPTI/Kunitz inhibitor domain-containing protein n=1 Tax=Manduca sexta TaxID=7130 RepID=A0A921YL33_MANSE|nr:uncharacterized protein LOC115443772 [Manduca sexta]KAG6441162.1 hypothetical protein O3G_MSEX001667 [Manduca sexta]
MNFNLYLVVFVLFFVNEGFSVPPEACFANFNWDDCGKPPVPVMYYWKPGSRCEVGLWKGCLPNLNMFVDEYECVTTCIFTARAMPEDYHNLLDVVEDKGVGTVPAIETTVAGEVQNATSAGDGETPAGGSGTGATGNVAGGEVTGPPTTVAA